jgi:tRNA 2-thiocytidine biosynthesis protein TtcA
MNAPDPKLLERQRREAIKLEKRLCRLAGQAIGDFAMIEAGDRVMVCLSGGKDSYGLLDILMKLRERAPIDFEIVAVNLDQRHPGFPEHILPEYLTALGVPFRIEVQDTYSIVKRVIPEGKTMCSLCSRTFFLNLFFGGKLKSMPPRLVSDDGKHVVIRPLAYASEDDLEAYAHLRAFPIIPCDLCGSQETLQRKQVKAMLREWDKRNPGRVETIFRSLMNVVPSHLLDRGLFDFAAVAAGAVPDDAAAVDIGFDVDVDLEQAMDARAGERAGIIALRPAATAGRTIPDAVEPRR